jgi:single-strand DNA-binding protein
MAGSLNKAMIIGNLGKDPESRVTTGGKSVANFTVATTASWTDKETGKREEKTEWHRVVAWGSLAETCAKYLTKGKRVYVEGRLQTREWTDKEERKNYTTEIVADDVQFLSPAEKSGVGMAEPESAAPHEYEPQLV